MAKIALAQTTSTDDFQANLAVAERMVIEAAENGADLLAFPEIFLYLGGYRRKLEIAEPLDGATVSLFREAAARHGIMLLLGSIHERIPQDPSRVYNTSVLIAANGDLLASYRKLKLFDVELPNLKIRESDSIAPGDASPPVVDTPIGKLGLTIWLGPIGMAIGNVIGESVVAILGWVSVRQSAAVPRESVVEATP